MKKLSLLILIACFLTINAISQTRTRLVDNFDMPNGVKVKSMATSIAAPTPNKQSVAPKQLVKKTAQITMSVQDAVSSRSYTSSSSTNSLMSRGTSMGQFTTGDPVIDSYITNSSIKYGMDPLLIYSQMHQESSFKLRATSNKGASGLMQLMPATARRFGVTNIYDPQQNIDAGVKYMRWLYDTFNGDIGLALAGYNAGEGAVMKYGNTIPPYNETQEYVRRITARYNSIKNPNYVRTAVKKVSSNQEVAKLDKKSAPLTVYERSPIAVRLPDGRMRLVNQ